MVHALSKVPRLSGCCLKHRLVPVADRSKRFTIQPCPILAANLYPGRSALPICYHHAQHLDIPQHLRLLTRPCTRFQYA